MKTLYSNSLPTAENLIYPSEDVDLQASGVPEAERPALALQRPAGLMAWPRCYLANVLSIVFFYFVTITMTIPAIAQQPSTIGARKVPLLEHIAEAHLVVEMLRVNEDENSLGPSYVLQIYQNGTVIYEGLKNVRVRGYKVLRANPGEVASLVSELTALGFFTDSYTGYGSGRSKSRLLIIDANDGKRFRRVGLADYFGSPPNNLALEAQLIDLIESIAPVTELRCPVEKSQTAVRRGLTKSGMEMCEHDWKVFAETFKAL